MKPTTALLALCISACAGPSGERGTVPTGRGSVADSCAVARPDFGAVAAAAHQDLFAYDVDAPMNLQRAVEFTNNRVEVSPISFSRPDGGSVTALMFNPFECSSPPAGFMLMRGVPGTMRIPPSRTS